MAIKFSQFNLRTDSTPTMFLVGYDGNQNIHITVDNLFNDFINGTENTIAMFGPGGTILADSIVLQDAGATQLTVQGELRVANAAVVVLDLTVGGNTLLNGNVTLGDISTDLISQTGTLYLNGPIKDTTNTLGIDEQILVSDAIGELTFRNLYDTTVGKSEAVVQTIKCNEAIPKGCPVYIVGFQPGENANIVAKADASNPAKMPATGVADEDYAAQDFGTMTAFGSFNGDFDTTGGTENWAVGQILYVKPGGGLTNIKPTGTNLIQNIAIVSRVQSQTGEMEVIALGRTNDIPNLTPGKIWVGSTGNTIESSSITFTEATGAVQLNQYGSGTITGTAARNLSVDSSGNIIETSTSASGSGTTNVLPIWTDGPNGVLGDSLITQTKVDGGTIFDLNAITTGPYTPAINTKLFDLNSGGAKKFSVTQDGGGGVVLPAGGGVTNPGPSFNMGGGAFSNGKSGVAMGSTTTAFGNGSLAANFLTLASGGGASAFGLLTEASALASAAFGNKSKATGNYSIASGQDSIASGQSSVAIGEKGNAQGKNTFVQGFGGTATANNAAKFGYEGSASGSNSVKFGYESIASGAYSLAAGFRTTASGGSATSLGDNNTASGIRSFVGGKNSTVTGDDSFSFGTNNSVSPYGAGAIGSVNTISTGSFNSFAAGSNNNTNGYSKVMLLGLGLEAEKENAVILGKYNDNTDSYDRFQIGNGSSNVTRSNSLSIDATGNVKLPTYGSGTVTGTATYNLSVDVNGRVIETPNPDAPIYQRAVLLLSQGGLGNPVNDNLLENGLGIPTPFNWTRISAGEYNLNATGKFKLLKTIVFINNGNDPQSANVTWQVIDTDNLRIYTGGNDGALTKASLEIRTYN
jgi:hypothetical protein